PKMSFGSIHGPQKTVFFTDTTSLGFRDTLDILRRPPKRLVYQKEKGIFLNELQEQITLEKLLWKEVYRQDAVAMYWVNIALEERVNEVIARNTKLEQDLNKAETEVLRSTANMEHYRDLYKSSEAQNVVLREDNSKLKVKLWVWRGIGITATGGFIYLGAKQLFFR
ncbi:hypothetical protein EB077_04445, partial [bacterium]|nr:hypothetical protein [bacterium]